MKAGKYHCEVSSDGSVLYVLVGKAGDETNLSSTETHAMVLIDRSADGQIVGIEILFPAGTLKD